jgi:iron complex outermembrane receptor protein
MNLRTLLKELMKYSLLGLFLQCMFLSLLVASDLEAQNYQSVKEIYISVKLKDASLKETFNWINNNTDLNFNYDRIHVEDLDTKISFQKNNATLEDLLLHISKKAKLKFKQVNNNISVDFRDDKQDEKEIEILLQGIRISGKITGDDAPDGMPGVNVVLQGTLTGTITDMDGNYAIEVPNENAVLVFSSVGYVSEEVIVGNNSVINLELVSDITALQEIVVIGYGSVEKKDVTGAVADISSENFNRGVLTSPQDLIVGKLAGVNVTTNSGAPGAGATIRIRGGSSLNANNDPLIIIDGFPVDNGGISGVDNVLATINPNDIETFTVLKDASATAIYGSRASNGVIIIATKKGGAGKPKFSFNSTFSVSQPIEYFDVLGANEYRALVDDLVMMGEINQSDVDSKLGGENTNWQDEVFRQALSTDNNLSLSGSVKSIPYRVSYGFTDQQGTLINTDISRHTLNLSVSPSFLNDHLKVTMNAKGSNVKSNFGDAGAVGAAISYDPTKPVRDDNELYGGYFSWLSVSGVPANNITFNPVAMAELTDNVGTANRLIGNIEFEYKFPMLPELKAHLNMGLDYQKSDGYNNAPVTADFTRVVTDGGTVLDGRANTYAAENKSRLLDFYLNYSKDLGDHKVDVTAGYGWQYFYRQNESVNRRADQSIVNVPPPFIGENYLVSFFGRANYSFLDKYLLTATVRYDASSRFNDPWGLFPAISAAWRIKDEAFLSGADKLTELKLRVGYGETGQQDIGNFYPNQAIYRTSNETAQYQLGNTFYPTLRPDAYDPNIKWETTSTLNIGVDFGLFDNRLTGTLEVYNRKTFDLLNTVQIASGTNFSNFLTTNVGDLENKGVELTLNAIPVTTDVFTWNLGVNFARNVNKLTKLLLVDDPSYNGVPTGSVGVGQFIQNQQVGFPINSFWVLQQVYGPDGMPIEGLYVNRSGENSPVPSNNNNKYRPEHPVADYLIGINSRLDYKSFDFSFSGRLSLGNFVYNNAVAGRAFLNNVYANGFFSNVPSAVYDTEFFGQQQLSDLYVQDASFFKMDNMSLGYSLNDLASGKLRARVSLTVQNAFIITNYDGIDPEVNGGIDNTVYPRPRVFLLGVNLDF